MKRPLRERFEDFRRNVLDGIDKPIPEHTAKTLERVFYSGAISAIALVHEADENESQEGMERAVEELYADIHTFTQESLLAWVFQEKAGRT